MTSNLISPNIYSNMNIEDIINHIECPICTETYPIFNFFYHLNNSDITHRQFLTTWTAMTFADLTVNDINTYTDDLSYEELTEICERVGDHLVGVKNIDYSAPSIVYSNETETIVCPICLDNLSKAEYNRKIRKCNHIFCGECIERWLVDHRICPVCKQDVPDESQEEQQTTDESEEEEQEHQQTTDESEEEEREEEQTTDESEDD